MNLLLQNSDCILSLRTLLWMDVILYDHFRLKYAKLVTMTSQESGITSQNSHHIVTLHHSHISLLCVLSPQSECPPLHPCISASSSTSDTVFTATVCCCCCHPFFPVCVLPLFTGSLNISTAWPRPHDQDHALTLHTYTRPLPRPPQPQ